MEQLLKEFGYLAVLVGTFLEGETVLVVAGFGAHQGYLSLPWVILAAFLGTLGGDQLWFWLGRRYGVRFLDRHPTVRHRSERAQRLFRRYGSVLVLSVRFLYGVRMALPFAIGMSRYPARRFFALDLLSAAIWAPLVAGLGYLFGRGLDVLVGDVRPREGLILLGILALGGAVWLLRGLRDEKRSRRPVSDRPR